MAKKKKLHGRQKHQADPGEVLCSNSSDDENNSQSNKCCPHVTKSVNLGTIKKAFKGKLQFGSCQNCSKNENNTVKEEGEEFCDTVWMCLQCCHQGCGRLSKSKHALEHYETPHSDSHAIVVNTSSWSIWCYQCDDEVDLESSKRLSECVEYIKKQVDILSRNSKPPSKPKSILKEMETENIPETIEKVPPKKVPIIKEESIKTNEPEKINGLVCDSSLAQVRGLVNLTNTCFFNAVLQNLSQIPCFLTALEEHCHVGKETEWKIKTPQEFENDIEDEYVTLPLPPSESVTVTLKNLLREMNSPPQQKKSPNVNPKPLFSLIVQRYSQFRGGYQQDSHEFLRCLLELVRTEEVKRQKKAVLKLFNLTEKTKPQQVEEEVKRKVKSLGKNALHTIVDRVFGGQIVSTVLCEQCDMTSQVFESFMDLSLPVCEEKPTRPGIRKKSLSEDGPESRDDNKGPSKYQDKKLKRQTKKELKKQAKLIKKSAKVVPLSGSSESIFRSEGTGNEDEGSEADVNDADIEDNEEENTSQDANSSVPTNEKSCKADNTSESTSTNDSIVADSDQSTSLSRTLSSSEVTIVGSDGDSDKEKKMDSLVQAVSELVVCGNKSESKDSLIESPEDGTLGSPGVVPKETYLGSTDSGLGNAEKPEEETAADQWKNLKEEWRRKSWTSLAPRYTPSSHECSVLSCLNLFTHPEFLMGKNKFGCDNCTRIKAEQTGVDKDKQEMVYTNAIKQLHVFNPPAVLTLHLKRFHQSGMSLTKVNQFVEFPLILDLAPFCSSIALGLPHLKMGQNKILYSLCGVVHHSGTLSCGHYAAFVRKRSADCYPANLSFLNDKALSQADVDYLLEEFVKKKDFNVKSKTESDASEGNYISEPEISGKWYHISDTHVSQVSESSVLRCQAYLLFYERIV